MELQGGDSVGDCVLHIIVSCVCASAGHVQAIVQVPNICMAFEHMPGIPRLSQVCESLVSVWTFASLQRCITRLLHTVGWQNLSK